MRVFRTILGMLLLTAGLPTLLVGAALWAAMQHRDPGGAFTGDMQRVATSGYALVVDDVDGLLRKDAPFVRFGDTRLRLTAQSTAAPASSVGSPTVSSSMPRIVRNTRISSSLSRWYWQTIQTEMA